MRFNTSSKAAKNKSFFSFYALAAAANLGGEDADICEGEDDEGVGRLFYDVKTGAVDAGGGRRFVWPDSREMDENQRTVRGWAAREYLLKSYAVSKWEGDAPGGREVEDSRKVRRARASARPRLRGTLVSIHS